MATSSTSTCALTVNKAGSGSGTVTGSGISCGTTCSATYASGTLVTLTAAAASGSTFSGWSGACGGTATCAVTMSAAQAIDTLAFFSDDYAESLALACKVADWTFKNMQAADGHFYYRDLGWTKIKTPMLHWGQGTMFKALAHLAAKLSPVCAVAHS